MLNAAKILTFNFNLFNQDRACFKKHKYSGHLNTILVWYSNGWIEVRCQMVWFSNAKWKPDSLTIWISDKWTPSGFIKSVSYPLFKWHLYIGPVFEWKNNKAIFAIWILGKNCTTLEIFGFLVYSHDHNLLFTFNLNLKKHVNVTWIPDMSVIQIPRVVFIKWRSKEMSFC